MPPSLKLSISITSAEIFRGESNFFSVVLKNEGGQPINNAPTFASENEALSLWLTPVDAVAPTQTELGPVIVPGRRIANDKSFECRQGIHRHGTGEVSRAPLSPGGQWTARADLLEWFGEVPPGTYNVQAAYNSGYDVIESPPVVLKILPWKPLAAAAARHGARSYSARATAAAMGSGPHGKFILAQSNSDALPKVPFHAIRVPVEAAGPVELRPATAPTAAVNTCHVLWSEGKQWHVAAAPLNGGEVKVSPLQNVMPGSVLASPLTHSDGGLAVPFADADLARLYLLRFAADGSLTSAPELSLDVPGPIGPHACCWQNDAMFHFAWCRAGAREVRLLSREINNPDAPVQHRVLGIAPGKVLWIDARIDADEAMAVRPIFVETGGDDPRHQQTPIPLTLKAWAITATPTLLTCTELSAASNRVRTVNLRLPKERTLTPLCSVIRPLGDLAAVCVDQDEELWYASTASGLICPLREVARKAIGPSQSPSLFAASSRGSLPWVYLRYLDAVDGRAAWVKLEPVGESEPGEHDHHH